MGGIYQASSEIGQQEVMTGRFSKHSSNRFQTRYSNKSNKGNGGDEPHEVI